MTADGDRADSLSGEETGDRGNGSASKRAVAAATAANTVLPWVGLASYMLACILVWTSDSWLPEWDSAIYLLTAKSLSDGLGYSYLGQDFFLRPPGFSWVLSFFVGSGLPDFRLLNSIVMAMAGASVIAIYFSLRTVVRSGPALIIALLTGTSWLYVRNFNWIVSEYPAVGLTFLAITLFHTAVRSERYWWWLSAAGGLALGASLYFRTAGLVLLPAVLVLGGLHFRRRAVWRALVPVLVALAVIAPWLVNSWSAEEAAQTPVDQNLLFSYGTAIMRVDPGDPSSPLISPGDVLKRIKRNSTMVASDSARAILPVKARWLVGCVASMLFFGLLINLKKKPSLLDALVLLYVPLLLVYFEYMPRLLLPLTPMIYLYLARFAKIVISSLTIRFRLVKLVPLVLYAGSGLLLVLNLLLLWAVPRPAFEPWQREIPKLASWIRDSTEEDARLLCWRAPIVSLLTNRIAYTYRFPREANLIEKYEIDYVIDDGAVPPQVIQQVESGATDRWTVGGWTIYELSHNSY